MFVIGTAGHIDHGKSTLVQALSGIDPDRLREEKERGMTIDLGFAWLKLSSGQEVGIVDVPGHERFIKNMLAGVGSIDLALLIVAANEGVMPQTREHLAILDILGIKRGIVVITKKDLVDTDLLDLVKMDIEELIGHTGLARSPVIAVSAVTREGITEAIKLIDDMLKSTEPRQDIGRPRLPIDRIFTISGAGTVITGTLLDGSLSLGQEVEIVPRGLKSRVRGLQTHKAKLNVATPGSRVAVNLVGITTSELKRGDVLTKPGWLTPTTMLSVQLRLLSYIRHPLRHGAPVSFHTGAAEAMAKVRLLEKEKLEPGETTWAQMVLVEPVAMVKGDRFIIRSPAETLGGGKIVDAHAKRLRRFRPEVIKNLKVKEEGTTEEVFMAQLEARQPLELGEFLSHGDLRAGDVQEAVESLLREAKIIGIGQGEHRLLFTAAGWERTGKEANAIVQDYHRRFPNRSGMPKVELGSRLKLAKYLPVVLPRLADEGVLREEGLLVRLPSHEVKLTPLQQAKIAAFLADLTRNPYAPATDQLPEPDLLNWLVEQQRVVKVSEGVVFATSAYNEMVAKITAYIKAHGKITLAETRDLFHTSRKYAQALLEHLDEKRVTRRVGDERVLY